MRICVTEPISTPLNLTGAPTLSPSTDPGKYMTKVEVFRNSFPEPKIVIPITASAMAPRTKAPITAGLALLPTRGASLDPDVRAPSEEAAYAGVVGVITELLRRAAGGDGPRLDVEEDAVGADREDARQFVRHDDDGRVETVADFEDLCGAEVRILGERHPDVLRQRHRAEERSALVEDADATEHPVALHGIGARETRAAVEDPPVDRFVQADHVTEQGALPGSARSHDDEDIVVTHGEIEVVHQNEAPERHGDAPDGDVRLVLRHQIPRM